MQATARDFLATWLDRSGGAERANLHAFIIGLCGLLDIAPPDPTEAHPHANDYVFERAVQHLDGDGGHSHRRIDLYKRGCFLLEAKQSRAAGRSDAPSPGLETIPSSEGRGRRAHGLRWDRLMRAAFEQARGYVLDLPPAHPAPPFLIICDVGHMFEVYADFSGTGRGYSYFPDRHSYRVYLEDLDRPEIRARFAAIWDDPFSLDPSRRRERATQEIAGELAGISLWLERSRKVEKPDAARFLMRCIFTMFACSVRLLPEGGFSALIRDCISRPGLFAPLVQELWTKMSDPLHAARFFPLFGDYVPHFGDMLRGGAYDLPPVHLEALLRASERSWSEVEPAVFGALLESALGVDDRRRLGAHFTPRLHVERIVRATVMEPLRADWRYVLVQIQRVRNEGDLAGAREMARRFLDGLRRIRVLDPACGTGNFLYIALELVKGLEAEVLETLAQLGASESLGLDGVEPRQFIGLELNPQAAVIAEIVLWIGFLQLHYKTHTGHPSEPILRGFGAVQTRDAVLSWRGYPLVQRDLRTGAEAYPEPRRPMWPDADFIVGNPPFMGGKDLRARLGDEYAEALWAAHPHMNRSADLVMYWWDRAAELLTRDGSRLRRFGFVTTNSITQAFQRQTVERWLAGETPVRLAMAVPDHPWIRGSAGAAAVRVAMTVVERGAGDGVLMQVEESAGDAGTPPNALRQTRGRINADLTIGVDLTRCEPLVANRGLCSPGVKLHGAGFIVSLEEVRALGLGRRPGLDAYIRPYCNGRDIVQRGRDAWVIDLYPLSAEAVRARFPEVYQRLLTRVKPERDRNRMAFRREHWWWFGATHEMYRGFTAALDRYIATPETAKHRIFVFLDAGVRADNMLVNVGSADAFHLGVLSARPHLLWARAAGAVLEDRPRYTKSACFDPYPLPAPSAALRDTLAQVAEELDGIRRAVRAEHPDLTLTALYNALDALRSGRIADPDVVDRGRVLILKELHAHLDALAAQAYGWPADLSDHELLGRLAELNLSRRAEERAGMVRWLRPDYQKARFAVEGPAEALLQFAPVAEPIATPRLHMPAHVGAQTVVVLNALEATGAPASAEELASRFSGGRRHLRRIEQALHVLELYGHVDASPGGRYFARRVA